MRLKYFFLFTILMLVVPSCFGQAKVITDEEYFDAYAAALQKTLDTPRSRTKKNEVYEQARLKRVEEEIEEMQSKDVRRFVEVEKVGLRETGSEVREIKGTFYCRQNRGAWKKSRTDCSPPKGFRVVEGDSNAKNEFTLESIVLGKDTVRVFRMKTTYFNQPDNKLSSSVRGVDDNKFWVAENGLIIRREYKRIAVENKDYSVLTENYDYLTRLNIKPPIK